MSPERALKGAPFWSAGTGRVTKTSTLSNDTMQPVSRPLLLLHPDEVLAGLLARIPGQPFLLQRVPDFSALDAALRRSPPTAIAVVDPCAAAGTPCGLAEGLRDMMGQLPSATVVAALHVDPQQPDVLRTLLDWGVAEWIDLARENTPAALGRRLRSVQSRRIERLLQRALPRGVSSRARTLLNVAADVVAGGGAAPEMAAALGVHRRTVPRWCERADLPPPQRLLAWLRVLTAADLLGDPGRSIESIARGCGYAGGPSFKSAVHNLMGTTPGELRKRGAFPAVAKAFAAELFDLRDEARQGGKPEKTWLH